MSLVVSHNLINSFQQVAQVQYQALVLLISYNFFTVKPKILTTCFYTMHVVLVFVRNFSLNFSKLYNIRNLR